MRKLIIPIQFIMVIGCLAFNGYAEQPKERITNSLEMEFAREVASQVVFMDEGKIIEIAPPNDFFTNPQTERGKYFLQSILTH